MQLFYYIYVDVSLMSSGRWHWVCSLLHLEHLVQFQALLCSEPYLIQHAYTGGTSAAEGETVGFITTRTSVKEL